MSEVRAVLLDLYDTLMWTEWPVLRAELEERFGLTRAELLAADTATRPARTVGAFGSLRGDVAAVLEAAGIRLEPPVLDEVAGRTTAFLERGVHLWEDSIPTLRELRARGVRTAVVSNCDHGTGPVVERLGLADEADEVILSFEVGMAKPDPGIYRLAAERLGVPAEAAVFVDDLRGYCDGAAAVGMGTFLILRDDAAPMEGTGSPGGHRVIRDLRALPDLVRPSGLSRTGA